MEGEGWRQHEARFRLLLADLGWPHRDLFSSADESHAETSEWATCPYDSSHRVRPDSLAKHSRKCSLRATGLPPPEGQDGPSALFYDGAPGVVRLSDEDNTASASSTTTTTSSTLAQTDVSAVGGTVATRGNEARLKRYNEATHAAKQIRQQRPDCKGLDIDLFAPQQPASDDPQASSSSSSSASTKARAQQLAEERDYRRRTKKYRARNVHITKRSPIEVARDFINNRMDEMVSIIKSMQPAGVYEQEAPADSAAEPTRHKRSRAESDERRESRDRDDARKEARKRQRVSSSEREDTSRRRHHRRER